MLYMLSQSPGRHLAIAIVLRERLPRYTQAYYKYVINVSGKNVRKERNRVVQNVRYLI